MNTPARCLRPDTRTPLCVFSGACYGCGYDTDYFELLGRALLATGSIVNAGRFLFLSGCREARYQAAIDVFIRRSHDPDNFRQLQSQLPERVRVIWRLKGFPRPVADELRALGWPEDTQRRC